MLRRNALWGELEGLRREGGGERAGFFVSGVVTLAAARRFAVLVSERRKGTEEGGARGTESRNKWGYYRKVGRSSFSFSFSFWSWRMPSSIALAFAPIPVSSLYVLSLSLSDISILIYLQIVVNHGPLECYFSSNWVWKQLEGEGEV